MSVQGFTAFLAPCCRDFDCVQKVCLKLVGFESKCYSGDCATFLERQYPWSSISSGFGALPSHSSVRDQIFYQIGSQTIKSWKYMTMTPTPCFRFFFRNAWVWSPTHQNFWGFLSVGMSASTEFIPHNPSNVYYCRYFWLSGARDSSQQVSVGASLVWLRLPVRESFKCK